MKTMHAPSSFSVSTFRFGLSGLAGAFLLGLLEWIDTNIKLTPVLHSLAERLVFTTYFSMNLLGGAVIGVIAGVAFELSSRLVSPHKTTMPATGSARLLRKLVSGFAVCALASLLLNQQPYVFAYATALLREAEKFSSLTSFVLAYEMPLSYAVVIGLLIGCLSIAIATRASRTWKPWLGLMWILGLIAAIGIFYYVDSRVEVQLYEPSLHQSMFLANVTLSMALAATLWQRFRPLLSQWPSPKARVQRALVFAASLGIIAAIVFTFLWFDKNQNLKTQVFYRTTQAKQYFRLARWVLDFDRDGYSPFLGGGDADDHDAAISPGAGVIVGDEIDNNCIGGDLTPEALANWNAARGGLQVASNPDARRLNLIYIFIDALRSDRLGTYGYARNTSPNLDRLAARSAVFENAYTPSPFTYAALPKFMQSSYWDGHYETWTEVLARNGYKTFLFPSRISFHLERHIKGSSHVYDGAGLRLPEVVDRMVDVIQKAGQDAPFCAYLYVPDPHMPYVKHAEFDFGTSLSDLYDGEIAFTDAALGRLFDWLEKSGRISDTIVVLMADHAESLGERAVYKHSTQLYDEQAQIPMIFYVPGLAPRRVSDYVSSIDLGTTILNSVGIQPPREYIGVSLLPLMRGEPFAHPPVFGEQVYTHDARFVPPEKYTHPASKKFMVITQDGFKLIYNRDYYSFELYNLRDDPGELNNLYDQMPEKARRLRKLVGQFVDITIVSRPPDAEETWIEPPAKRLKRGRKGLDY